jgi:hypothetical protein
MNLSESTLGDAALGSEMCCAGFLVQSTFGLGQLGTGSIGDWDNWGLGITEASIAKAMDLRNDSWHFHIYSVNCCGGASQAMNRS